MHILKDLPWQRLFIVTGLSLGISLVVFASFFAPFELCRPQHSFCWLSFYSWSSFLLDIWILQIKCLRRAGKWHFFSASEGAFGDQGLIVGLLYLGHTAGFTVIGREEFLKAGFSLGMLRLCVVGIPIFFWFSVVRPFFLPSLMRLFTWFRQLQIDQVEYSNWSEAWRLREVEEIRKDPNYLESYNLKYWLEEWQENHRKTFWKETLLLLLFFGEDNITGVRQLFLADNMEHIKRWALLTGQEIPLWD